MDSSHHAPAMGTEGILQLKFPVPVMDPGTAEENGRLHPHVFNFPYADNLTDVDPQQLPLLILQLEPQRRYGSVRATHRYHIHRPLPCHRIHPPSFVCFIVAHLFVYIKRKILVATFPRICYNGQNSITVKKAGK